MGMEIQIDNLEDMCKLMCDNELPEKVYKYCKRCNRRLRSPQAKLLGYGPVCYKKIKTKNALQRKLF